MGEIQGPGTARSSGGVGHDPAVTQPRRHVRVSDAFFRRLDDQLKPDRGPDGQPSATDFLVRELPEVVDRFATDFEGLPEIIDGVPGGRMLIAGGLLVRAFVVYGVLLDDGSIELIGVEFDTSP